MNGAVANDWRLSVAVATSLSSAVTNMPKAISGAIDLPGTIGSAACINISDRPIGTDGTKQNVDHVEVGRVLDTVRRRRNALVEAPVVGGQIDW
jgi:hypothetical protein